MYLDSLDLVAVSIALVAQMTLNIILFISLRRQEQAYHKVVRLLKMERSYRR
jgi:hypothetical protein